MAYRLLLSLLFPLCFVSTVASQGIVEDSVSISKLGFQLRASLNRLAKKSKALSSSPFVRKPINDTISVVINCFNQEEVCAILQKKGIPFKHVVNKVITARLTPQLISEIAPLASVRHIIGPQHFYPKLDKSRAASMIDEIHSGTNLETPYTGKNVIIGFLDIGFLYSHPAFRVTPDSTRIISVLELDEHGTGTIYEGSSEIISHKEDSYKEAYHGTHVMCIAGGGKENEEQYYGYAPDALLVPVSNDFENINLFNGIVHIKEVANKLNLPFVINMSFGSNTDYDHDDCDEFGEIIDSLSEAGCIFIASAGNERYILAHAYHEFTEEQDTCVLTILPNDGDVVLNIVGSDSTIIEADRPTIFDTQTMKFIPVSDTLWNDLLENSFYMIKSNGRYVLYLRINSEIASEEIGDGRYLCIRLKGEPGQQMNAFIETNTGSEFTDNLKYRVASALIDNKVNINMPSGFRSVVSVGSYNTKTSWKDIDGNLWHSTYFGDVDQISGFSSLGPMLDSTIIKPDVCAPGAYISSAVKDVFVEEEPYGVTKKVSYQGEDYYYGALNGTSMSTPAVTGSIALWLQANPRLNYKDVMEIIHTTSKSDDYTGLCPNPTAGFGKLNAYEGLKMALKLTGIESLYNSNAPISILKQEQNWKILFNSQESYARLTIYNIEGQLVSRQSYQQIVAGDEQIVSFSNLPSGIYLLRVETSNYQSTYKFAVK